MKNSQFDVSDELLIMPFGSGIKLIRPDNKKEAIKHGKNLYTIKDIFHTGLYVYFLDNNSNIRGINESSIIKCGYPTLGKTIGKNRLLVAPKKVVEKINHEDHYVIKNNILGIFEEEFTLLNNISFPSIAIKFPWYNLDNNIIGIFACSIMPDNMHSVIETLNFLLKLNLLITPNNKFNQFTFLPGKQVNGCYLTIRESEIVELLVKGKTVKEIAMLLKLSPRTVEHYIENIKYKVGVNTKSDLIESFIGK